MGVMGNDGDEGNDDGKWQGWQRRIKNIWGTMKKLSNNSRNQPKCNHCIYNSMWLIVVCN